MNMSEIEARTFLFPSRVSLRVSQGYHMPAGDGVSLVLRRSRERAYPRRALFRAGGFILLRRIGNGPLELHSVPEPVVTGVEGH
jgi:hypothetical protein